MNENGNVIIFIIIGLVAIAALPPIILSIFPEAKILFQILMIFTIYSAVRGYLGSGPLTLVISAVLIYYIAFKYVIIVSALWAFQILLMFGFTSVIVWGIGTSTRNLQMPKPGG
ncbi:MAG: hypothetical protein V1676_03705 [Candidatus Diapherotrites archaeon]